MILTTLTLAAGITLAADIGSGLSYKDSPVYTTNAAPERRPTPPRRRIAVPPVPDSNIYDRMAQGIHPFIRVEGIKSPLPMTKEELEKWGLESGDTIPVSLAAKIIEEKIQRSRE
jgi:hypothetical protein